MFGILLPYYYYGNILTSAKVWNLKGKPKNESVHRNQVQQIIFAAEICTWLWMLMSITFNFLFKLPVKMSAITHTTHSTSGGSTKMKNTIVLTAVFTARKISSSKLVMLNAILHMVL